MCTCLVLRGGRDGRRVEHLLEVVLFVDGGVLVQASVVRGAQHPLQHVLQTSFAMVRTVKLGEMGT